MSGAGATAPGSPPPGPAGMTARERFLAAASARPVDRPPVWIMRQAGRYLPEYRALKEKHGFVEMVSTPELATEVTLQPLRRFPLDAAILFSDILIVPEALGQPYRFRDGGGIEMAFRLEGAADIAKLDPSGIPEKLAYVPDALRLIRAELGESTALLGFGGAPWTLATYMVEGGSSKDFSRVKELFYRDRPAFEALMEKVTAALGELLALQVEAGADAVQIFDSWAAACPGHLYRELSLRWIQQAVAALPAGTPVILFAKGMYHHHGDLARTGAGVLGLDWSVDIGRARTEVPAGVALQGNLDPAVLDTDPATTRRATRTVLDAVAGRPGHIFNLGHGILPTAKPENVAALVDEVAGAGAG